MDREALKVARELGDHLVILSSTFDLAPQELKAVHFRRCEKSLLVLERSFTSQLAHESRAWLEAYHALQFLMSRKQQIDELEEKRLHWQENLNVLNTKSMNWTVAPKEVQEQLIFFGNQTKDLLESGGLFHETATLNRYERYCHLKPLLPFIENKDHLCDALMHFDKHETYENRITELQNRIKSSTDREKTVHRGFLLALGMCIFVITIPFCFPFVYSLWGRRKEIIAQLTQFKEEERLERRRLEIAQEGAIAHDEVKAIAGPIPTQQLRLILTELEELHKDFTGPRDNASDLTGIFCYLEEFKTEVERICGPYPPEPENLLRWFSFKVDEILHLQDAIQKTQLSLNTTVEHLHRLLRGHGKPLLIESIERLKKDVETTHPMPYFGHELAQEMASICQILPGLLFSTRELMGYLTQGYRITDQQWFSMGPHLRSAANRFGACVVYAEALAGNGLSGAQSA